MKNMTLSFFCLLFTSTFITGCSDAPSLPEVTLPESPQLEGYDLVWRDEFDVDGVPDDEKWGFETGFIRNEELQYYQSSNARCENGLLIIEARRETVNNARYIPGSEYWINARETAEYTSASLISQGKYSVDNGRIEMSARINTQLGSFPAFWLMGDTWNWPKCGEIDIMEFITGRILANFYWDVDPDLRNKSETQLTDLRKEDPDWDNKFHTWVFEKDDEMMSISLDGVVLNTQKVDVQNDDGTYPFKQPRYMILNLAIGSVGGDPTNSEFPMTLEVDYVRVYKKKTD